MSVYNLLVGKDDSLDTSTVGMTHAVVVKLLEGLEGRGHHVYTDNFYTSPALFGDLRRLGFGACGTVRINRRGVPPEMKAPLKKGETTSTLTDSSMMALKWMDKRPVVMLSTIHDNSFVTKKRRSRTAPDGQEDIFKPLVVEEYNQNMGGVDTGKKIYNNNIYISPFCYARLTVSPQQYRRPAGVLLRVLPPDHQVVEEALLPPDRHGHRQRLHSVPYVSLYW